MTWPRDLISAFRRVFVLVWLLHDVINLVLNAEGRWQPHPYWYFAAGSLLLMAQGAALVLARPHAAMLMCCLVRAGQAYLFPLNDYQYYCITALILAYVPEADEPPRWQLNVLRAQTAWMYFATALLKLNPQWLSGGDLYVRQNYLLISRQWPFPAFYQAFISTLPGNAALAWLGVTGEFVLAAFLLCKFLRPDAGQRLAWAAASLAVGIHVFAALSDNVWFFGASMICQVTLLMAPGTRPADA